MIVLCCQDFGYHLNYQGMVESHSSYQSSVLLLPLPGSVVLTWENDGYSYQFQNYASFSLICSSKINVCTVPPDVLKTREWGLRPLKQLLGRIGKGGREANAVTDAIAREDSKSNRCWADFHLTVFYFCFLNILQMNLIGETSNISIN